ncbi:MAG: glycerophosphodiester phosphodiesterase [Proteobacteria bacterium]|nr:glycerophosphodiester phosphodiesterase [Pseudomonadota bacterium]
MQIDVGAHKVRLKWHCLRKSRDDVPFTLERLVDGLKLGASLEVDLRLHADGGFVLLHDETLDRETTGSGRVADATLDVLRALVMRAADGRPSRQRLILLEDIVKVVRLQGHPNALVQLDLKAKDAVLDEGVIEAFRDITAPFSGQFILGGDDWAAVTRLAAAVPALAVGFDPCPHGGLVLTDTRSALDFAEWALAASPGARMLYLHYPLILRAQELDVDLVAKIHAQGKQVDAWTFNTDQPDADAVLGRLIDLRVDQITTDEPMVIQERAEALLARSGAPRQY